AVGEPGAAADRRRDHYALRTPAVLPRRRGVLRRRGSCGDMKATPVRALRKMPPITHWQPTLALAVGVLIFWFVAREVSPILSLVIFGVLAAVVIRLGVTRRRARYDLGPGLAVRRALRT